MSKKSGRDGKTDLSRGDESAKRPPTVPTCLEGQSKRIDLTEVRPGFYLNVDHIVSVRVLPQEESGVYAIMQLSNGDKQNLTHSEFTAITGEEPRPQERLVRNPQL